MARFARFDPLPIPAACRIKATILALLARARAGRPR
jgi:hypothetical protein